MLIGEGPHLTNDAQVIYPQEAYHTINALASKAWHTLPTPGTKSEELAKIRQGPDEPYQDFVSRFLQAVNCLVPDREAEMLLVTQLAYENANSACQSTIRPWKKKGSLLDYIRLCADIGPSYIQGLTLPAALQGATIQGIVEQQQRNKEKGRADPITWTSDNTVWVEQWPLSEEKIQAAQQLVQEQLAQGHTEESNSTWNTPIFVIKKKSGKWRQLQDLRAVNKTMEIMGPLQPGLPSLVAIPARYHFIVLGLKDCFFTIPLYPADCKRFAFSVPSTNFKEPMQRYHWRVLPQGMANSPTLCQKFVATAVKEIQKIHPEAYVIHYMDDVLVAHHDPENLKVIYSELELQPNRFGLVIAPKKIQQTMPYNYLGKLIEGRKVRPQQFQFRTDSLSTLNDFQKLLGDINWIRPSLGLTMGELKPLFDILCGNPDPRSPRELTIEEQQALEMVENAISQQQVIRIDYTKAWQLIILPTNYFPTGLFWQEAPIEWIHLSSSRKKVITPYAMSVAQLILQGRKRAIELFGKQPATIIVPYSSMQQQWLWQNETLWQIAFSDYSGQINCHYQSDKLLQLFIQNPVIFPKTTSKEPLSDALLVFTDGLMSGIASYVINNQGYTLNTKETSAQRVELVAVIAVFKCLQDVKFNLYTDSKYIVSIIQGLETATLTDSDPSTVITALLSLQQLIQQRTLPCFVGHIRAHSILPGPLAEGNAQADMLTHGTFLVISSIEQAQASHALHHQNASGLRKQFNVTREAN
ncbi:PREDICTED: endogenous retrovirus group K member 25 Pol protein-like [Miniopterus natalensis]|uniref:endogenous retrovirus group K member 25 Pol protein-like n=1 Tax=Miniopterus natalensis TaxID=291302 RepID=UPI0007A708A6|nr:PREDICTED: endogenous retrovirus group K member 25 Pol protein-like [Miniopterus natalensis]